MKSQFLKSTLSIGCHAEEHAIQKYNFKRHKKCKKLHLVVVRVDDNGELCNSKPCSNCVQVLKNNNIRKVTYSVDDGGYVTMKTKNIQGEASSGHRTIQELKDKLNLLINRD